MESPAGQKLAELHGVLDVFPRVAVAVSGGVDSMTLAEAAHRRLGAHAMMFHAVSPAVPRDATDRVLRLAGQSGWALEIVDAGEFSDPDYLRNPVNRCYFCKTNLYRTIAARSEAIILSGANLDDLDDFRPGLGAAQQAGVRHPFIEAGIGKSMIRSIARHMELSELADLPASPCLSSRIETGIDVTPAALRMVEAIERLLAENLDSGPVRCRVRRDGLVIELGDEALVDMQSARRSGLRQRIDALGAAGGGGTATRYERYRMGSAFLRDES